MMHESEEEYRPLVSADPAEDSDEFNMHADLDDAERESTVDFGLRDGAMEVSRPTPQGGPIEQWEANEIEERRQVGGAAVAGGIAGIILGGPLVALVLAGGAAAVATTKGKAGNVARATGEAMASAGDRLKKMDEKHHISDKAAKGVIKSANWVSQKLKPKHEKERDAMYGLTA